MVRLSEKIKDFSLKTAVFYLFLCVSATLWADPSQRINLTERLAKETFHLADLPRESLDVLRAAPVIGTVESFYTFNVEAEKIETTKAVLRKIGKHCYIYVEYGKPVSAASINKIASVFDSTIYPNTRAMFGSEWKPGIDNDARITILLTDIKDGFNPSKGKHSYVAGYFNAGDCYSTNKYPASNQREMLYLDINPVVPASHEFLSTLAHEFQHMIHWNNDSKEFTWLNESMSQLAPYLCGLGHPLQIEAFISNPDNSLIAWSDENMIANYGQVYMWAQYLSTRVVDTATMRRRFIRRLVANKSQGLSSITSTMREQKLSGKVSDLFRFFCAANYLNDSRVAGGIYGYESTLRNFYLQPEISMLKVPGVVRRTVKCWSAKAIQINAEPLRGKYARVAFTATKMTAANKYNNEYDLAIISFDSAKKAHPHITWLPVKDYKVFNQYVRIPLQNDRILALVVHRGPESMKAEQGFAKGASSAIFNFAISGIYTAKEVKSLMTARTLLPNEENDYLLTPSYANLDMEDFADIFIETSERLEQLLTEMQQAIGEVSENDSVEYEILQNLSEQLHSDLYRAASEELNLTKRSLIAERLKEVASRRPSHEQVILKALSKTIEQVEGFDSLFLKTADQ